MLNKEQVLKQRLGSINEAVFKQGDVYKVKTTVDVPKSLVNQFVSKAKKEHNVDPKENWSEIDLVEMFVNYVLATYLNIDSIPVDKIVGENDEKDLTTNVTENDVQNQNNSTSMTNTTEATPAVNTSTSTTDNGENANTSTPTVNASQSSSTPEGTIEKE